MTRSVEHPSKAGGRQGRFVVLPDAEAADVTVRAFADPDDEELLCEGLLARRLTPTTARLCGVPLFVHDLALGDVVETIESGEDAPVVARRVAAGGQRTWRAILAARGGRRAVAGADGRAGASPLLVRPVRRDVRRDLRARRPRGRPRGARVVLIRPWRPAARAAGPPAAPPRP